MREHHWTDREPIPVYRDYVITTIDVRGSMDSIDREIVRLAEMYGGEGKPWKATVRRFGTEAEVEVTRHAETEERVREFAQKFIDRLHRQAGA